MEIDFPGQISGFLLMLFVVNLCVDIAHAADSRANLLLDRHETHGRMEVVNTWDARFGYKVGQIGPQMGQIRAKCTEI